MNIERIEKTWNEYSKLNNIKLKFKERNQGNVIQSHYLINYTNEIASFMFIGIIWKATEGQNTDKTSIIVEFKNRLAISNFEIKTTAHQNSILYTDKTVEFEKSILNKLKKFDGNSITLKDNFVRIDTNQIFSTIEEFNCVTELILMVKTAGNKE